MAQEMSQAMITLKAQSDIYTTPQYNVLENMITALHLVQESKKEISNYTNIDKFGVEDYERMEELLLSAKDYLLDVLMLCREIEDKGRSMLYNP